MADSTTAIVVTGPVAVIRLKDGGGDRYLYRGAIVDPTAYDADSLEHMKGLGLLGEVEIVSEEVTVIEGEEMPDAGDSTWTHDRIDEYAREHGISYDGITAKNAEKPTREEKVAHIHANTPEAVLTPADQS